MPKKKKSPQKRVEIAVVPEATAGGLGAAERARIEQVVEARLLARTDEPYHRIQVEVERTKDGVPAALVVSMLRARTYTADVYRVEVDPSFNVVSITPPPPAGTE